MIEVKYQQMLDGSTIVTIFVDQVLSSTSTHANIADASAWAAAEVLEISES